VKTFRVHFKSAAGDQYMLVQATNAEKAEQEATRAQYRRQERFQLTFARLEQARESGDTGLLAVPPGTQATEAWVKAETERRRRDQVRYDDDTFKVASVEEVK
jgi:hypothetical protein